MFVLCTYVYIVRFCYEAVTAGEVLKREATAQGVVMSISCYSLFVFALAVAKLGRKMSGEDRS